MKILTILSAAAMFVSGAALASERVEPTRKPDHILTETVSAVKIMSPRERHRAGLTSHEVVTVTVMPKPAKADQARGAGNR